MEYNSLLDFSLDITCLLNPHLNKDSLTDEWERFCETCVEPSLQYNNDVDIALSIMHLTDINYPIIFNFIFFQ